VVADSWWQARQALGALAVQWDEGPHATLSTSGISRQLHGAVERDRGLTFRSVGDARDALRDATRRLEATYEAPYLAHAAMEPLNATVRVTHAGVEVWTGTQVPGFARAAVGHHRP
jgi:isoquinoline 1-oxidoreductase beta subunit